MKFTEEHYQSLKRFCVSEVSGLIVVEEDSMEMKVLEHGLDAIKTYIGLFASVVSDFASKEWFAKYGVALGTLVHLPPTWTPFRKACGLIHEVQHVFQFLKRQPQSDLPSNLGFAWLYTTWGEARMRLEVEAYRAGHLEFYSELTGTMIDLDDIAHPLEGTTYLLSNDNKKDARNLFEMAYVPVMNGASPSTAAGQLGRRWLDQYPELQLQVEE